ncbi:N-acetyltransferase family protein [Methylobacterium sp. A54F]
MTPILRPVLRPALDADLPAITRIYAEAVTGSTASFEFAAPDGAEMGRRRAALAAGGYPYLVAEAGGAVLGYAYAGPYRARAAYASTVEDSIYVDAPARGRRVGRLLLAGLVSACEAAGFRQMVAVITQADSAGSVALHAGLGFTHVGTLAGVGHKHGHWLGTILMQRALGPGTAAPPTRA